jgi:predicted AlkP superfamily phosphohydrolase/phosphomutase
MTEAEGDAPLASSERFKEGARKIVFIGIDAADWDIIFPLVKQGKMPNLATIMENGAWANLKSFGGTSSPIVWTTIATGKMPDKHGISDFIVKDRNSNETRPIDRTYRKTKALWNMFSDFGVRVGVIDWLITFPPEDVNGYVIANLMFGESHKSNPPDVQEYYEQELTLKHPERKMDSDAIWKKKQKMTWDEMIAEQSYTIYYAEQVALAMNRKYDVDFMAVYTHAVDEIQHFFWKFRAPEYFQDPIWELNQEDVEKYGGVIDDFYVRADEMIGRFMKPNHTIMVVSDHGSVPYKKDRTYFQINRLLESAGFLTFVDNRKEETDFSKSRAYEGGFSRWSRKIGVSVNLEGREARGVVPAASFEKMVDELISELSTIKIAETDQPIFRQVVRVGEYEKKDELVANMDIVFIQSDALLYSNPAHHIALNDKRYPLADYLDYGKASGGHSLHGIFAAAGEGIKPGRVSDSKVADVTPTLLHMMGLPVGKDMDGSVIKEMFTEEYLKDNPIRYVESHDAIGEGLAQKEEERGASTVNDEVKAKLRALGYID